MHFTMIHKRKNNTYIQKLSRNDNNIPVASHIQHSLQPVRCILLAPRDKCASRRGTPLKQWPDECKEQSFNEWEKPYDQFKKIIYRVSCLYIYTQLRLELFVILLETVFQVEFQKLFLLLEVENYRLRIFMHLYVFFFFDCKTVLFISKYLQRTNTL